MRAATVLALVPFVSCAPAEPTLDVASSARSFGAGDEYGTILEELPPLGEGVPWICVACAGAGQGDVVDLTGLSVVSAPDPGFLPAVSSDRALVFSDSPESPSTSGVLARASLAAGDARVFAWHANGFSGGSKKVVIVVENPNDAALVVNLQRFVVAGPTTSYVSAGRDAVRAFLDVPENATKSIAPGSSALLLSRMNDVALAPHQLVHAIVDAHFSAPARLHVIALDPGSDALAHFASLAALPRDVHDRGTFPGADRVIAMPADRALSASRGVTRVRIGGDTPVAPEPAGVDELTGATASLAGHYGVRYRIQAPVDDAGALAVLLNPRAGAYAGAALVNGVVVDVVASDASRAVLLAVIPAGGVVDIELMPPGASSLPVDVLFAPVDD